MRKKGRNRHSGDARRERAAPPGSLETATGTGEATAESIPGARLLLVSDMGHDVPRQLWPVIVDAIAGNVRISQSATTGAGV